MAHTIGVRSVDLEGHHHHGGYGKSWLLDRKSSRLFPRDVSLIQEAPSTPDAKNLAIVVQAPLVLNTSNTSLESPTHNSKMSYPQPPAAGAYGTATSYRQCVQRFADRHHYTVHTTYHGGGPGHAQAWRAQTTLTRRMHGHEVTVVDHISAYWYTRQADAKEAASAEVWTMLFLFARG